MRLKHVVLGLLFPVGLGIAITGCQSAPSTSAAPGGGAAAGGQKIKVGWDWTGIIGTGQSLSVGQNGKPAVSTTQKYNNMQLSTGSLKWPIDPNDPALKLVPLTEPIGRPSTSYPSAWPTNIAGETPHTAMAEQLTAMFMAANSRDFVSIHECVGENGQGMKYIKKNPDPDPKNINGHAYEGSMVETKAIARLAKAAGKVYGVGAITMTHGETDAGNQQYEAQLVKMLQDYNADISEITGQTQPIIMIISQQNTSGNHAAAMQAEWKIGVDHPKDFVCSGPKYQYPSADALHTTAEGYRELGEKYAQVYYARVILGKDWQPLMPTSVDHDGAKLTVHFHVPVGPMVWADGWDLPHQAVAEWKAGKGFEVSDAANKKVMISAVEIGGDTVVITCGSDPGAKSRVSYAMEADGKTTITKPFKGVTHWGLLRDSDPFKGAATGVAAPNYAVAFDMNVP